jgi:hypothetical protein
MYLEDPINYIGVSYSICLDIRRFPVKIKCCRQPVHEEKNLP